MVQKSGVHPLREIGSLSNYLQGFVHPRWCRIYSINSISSLQVKCWLLVLGNGGNDEQKSMEHSNETFSTWEGILKFNFEKYELLKFQPKPVIWIPPIGGMRFILISALEAPRIYLFVSF